MPRSTALDNEIRLILKTGKAVLGTKRSLKAVRLGKARAVILASKISRRIEEDIKYYAKLGDIPVIKFDGSSHELGTVCGKPFPVSVIAVLDLGDSTILEKKEEGEEPVA
jgi:large subunit ribosomal protein L30e